MRGTGCMVGRDQYGKNCAGIVLRISIGTLNSKNAGNTCGYLKQAEGHLTHQCTSSGISSRAFSVVTSALSGGRKNKNRKIAAARATPAGTRNSLRKSVLAALPVPVVKAASNWPPATLPANGPS